MDEFENAIKVLSNIYVIDQQMLISREWIAEYIKERGLSDSTENVERVADHIMYEAFSGIRLAELIDDSIDAVLVDAA